MFLCTTVRCPGTTNSPGLWTWSQYRYGSQSLAPQMASTASCSHCCTPRHKQRMTSSWCPSRSWWSSPQPTAITQAKKTCVSAGILYLSYRFNAELNSTALCAVPGQASSWKRHVNCRACLSCFSPSYCYILADFELLDQRFYERLLCTSLLELTTIIWAAGDNNNNNNVIKVLVSAMYNPMSVKTF